MQQQYRHEAVPYRGQDEFLTRCAALADQATDDDCALLFLLSGPKAELLRQHLNGRHRDLSYVDMDEHGRNPARLLTLLDGFRSTGDGRHCTGVNEPLAPGRAPEAVREAQFGESLFNSNRLQPWSLNVVCLYNAEALDEDALAAMRCSHPSVHGEPENASYDADLADALFAQPLPAAPRDAVQDTVREPDVAAARRFVRSFAAGVAADRREDLVLAANEVVTNSLQYGGGECGIAMWDTGGSVVFECRDAGHINDPLVGRLPPARDATAGRGLWLANHLCDLVQIRSSQHGTTVRLHVDR
jgi:anti-sigma regulatory factor (Ser/Thr protein kinase)